MRRLVKYVVGQTYKPLLVKYLSGTRQYRYRNIRLEIPPEVFHPGFFFSTKRLLKFLAGYHLAGKRFLELGAGSGLISIFAAKKGAFVTASDINKIAVTTLRKNKFANEVELNVIESDMFAAIPPQRFDFIAINPPYYKKYPGTAKDYAWYCGENGEYFQQLFQGLANYIHPGSHVLMVLCDACDLDMIKSIAALNGFIMHCVSAKTNLLEKNFIYSIHQNVQGS